MAKKQTNLDNFARFFSLMNSDTLTKEDFAEAFDKVMGFVTQIRQENASDLADVKTAVEEAKANMVKGNEERLVSAYNAIEERLGNLIQSADEKHRQIDEKLRVATEKREMDEAALSLKTAELVKEELKIPTADDVLNDIAGLGERVRDSLEMLEGKERLTISAIDGVDELISKIKPVSGGGGGHTVLGGLMDVDLVTDLPTDGQALTYDATNQKWKATTAAGTGDVIKVGTPVDSQIGVWTGDGTIEGDAALTFDTATDTLATGIVTVTDDAYAVGWNGSTAVPTKNALYDKIETLGSPEGTAVKSTGEVGGTKFLREDGDNTSSWQPIPAPEGSAVLSTGEVGGTKFLREDGDGTSSWQTVPINIVDDTTPQLGGDLDTNGNNITIDDTKGVLDESGNEQLIFQTTVGAVNYVEIQNGATGTGATIRAAGSDANIDLNLVAETGGYIDLNHPNIRLHSFTGVLRADDGVVSVDGDVTDIVAAGTDTAAGKLELATDAETVTGTDTARATTPANITAKMAAPGTIGSTTPGAATFTTVTTTGNIELGHASDTTLSRSAAGTLAVEGVDVLTTAGGTLTGNITLGENTAVVLDGAVSATDKWTGTVVAGTAGTTVAFGDALYLAVADSRWELVDASAVGTAGTVPVFLALGASTDGSAVNLLVNGIVRDTAWTWTVGAPIYLSETGTTGNTLTATAPSTTDAVVKVVGYALTADTIYWNPSVDHLTVV